MSDQNVISDDKAKPIPSAVNADSNKTDNIAWQIKLARYVIQKDADLLRALADK